MLYVTVGLELASELLEELRNWEGDEDELLTAKVSIVAPSIRLE